MPETRHGANSRIDPIRRLRPQVPAGADNCSILASFQQIANHTEPLREHRLMSVFRRHEVLRALQVVRQVLLSRDMVGLIVRVEVPVTWPRVFAPA